MRTLLLIITVVVAGLILLGIQGMVSKVSAHTMHTNAIINDIN